MRVMGVDPGLTRCGLSLIESAGGRQVIALDVDVVRTPADDAVAPSTARDQRCRRVLDGHPSARMWSRSSGSSPSRMCRP